MLDSRLSAALRVLSLVNWPKGGGSDCACAHRAHSSCVLKLCAIGTVHLSPCGAHAQPAAYCTASKAPIQAMLQVTLHSRYLLKPCGQAGCVCVCVGVCACAQGCVCAQVCVFAGVCV